MKRENMKRRILICLVKASLPWMCDCNHAYIISHICSQKKHPRVRGKQYMSYINVNKFNAQMNILTKLQGLEFQTVCIVIAGIFVQVILAWFHEV